MSQTIPTSTRTDRWAGLDSFPTGPRANIKAAIARRLFHGAVRRLPVSVRDQSTTVGTGGPEMTITRPEEFYARVGSDGLIGFGEAYLTGAWESPDLGGFLTVLAAELPRLVPAPLQRLRAAYVRRPPLAHLGSRGNSRTNVSHHYDLSNELFAMFLDPTLSYSSALFATSISPGQDEDGAALVAAPPEGGDLTEAQARKIERLLDEAAVGSGTRVLEIGTGWGELAIRAARRGAVVHSVTLSVEQLELAQERVDTAGVSDLVRLELCDYRDLLDQGSRRYDAVVSVEMIEAVGHEYWTAYFRTIDALLAPGGRVAIQAITMPHDRMLATRQTWTWINKYIFPGGFLPSVRAIRETTRDHTSLRLRSRLSFGQHYAETLHRWDRAFSEARDEVDDLGFDATFRRMWHFYLEYSRAGFAAGYIDVHQLSFTRETS